MSICIAHYANATANALNEMQCHSNRCCISGGCTVLCDTDSCISGECAVLCDTDTAVSVVDVLYCVTPTQLYQLWMYCTVWHCDTAVSVVNVLYCVTQLYQWWMYCIVWHWHSCISDECTVLCDTDTAVSVVDVLYCVTQLYQWCMYCIVWHWHSCIGGECTVLCDTDSSISGGWMWRRLWSWLGRGTARLLGSRSHCISHWELRLDQRLVWCRCMAAAVSATLNLKHSWVVAAYICLL